MKRVTRDHTTYVLSRDTVPVIEVDPGEEVIFETLDASGGRIRTPQDGVTIYPSPEETNPATGPVYVRGAHPGDSLAVQILGIRLGPYGYSRIKPGSGVIIDELRPPVACIFPIEGDSAVFSPRIRVPLRPMIGTIGTAPEGPGVPTFYPGHHGGNLDINDVTAGATIYLPVHVEGALLALGDVHASMGDGELTGGGIDAGAEVTVRLDVLEGRSRPRPWIETPTSWITCANASSLAGAIRLATSDMATLLAEKLSISREEAFILIGACGDARPGQAAGLEIDATARVGVPRLG